VDKVSVKSGPEILVEKDGRLFVRTYDTDYVFDLRERSFRSAGLMRSMTA
jgi:hypothetical protein